jgi:hypothetical protein
MPVNAQKHRPIRNLDKNFFQKRISFIAESKISSSIGLFKERTASNLNRIICKIFQKLSNKNGI